MSDKYDLAICTRCGGERDSSVFGELCETCIEECMNEKDANWKEEYPCIIPTSPVKGED